MEFRVLNVYGPYVECAPFWDSLLNNNLLKVENLIMGGYIKFSMGEAKVWGSSTYLDPQYEFFSHLIFKNGLIDISPLKLLPT